MRQGAEARTTPGWEPWGASKDHDLQGGLWKPDSAALGEKAMTPPQNGARDGRAHPDRDHRPQPTQVFPQSALYKGCALRELTTVNATCFSGPRLFRLRRGEPPSPGRH